MSERKVIFIVLILVLSILSFGIYNYLFSIYEVIYKVVPDALYADNKSEVTITAIPINGMGSRALFREVEAGYTIIEGADLVTVTEQNQSEGMLKIRAKDKPGIVKITAKSPYALLPSPINIKIYPNIVEVIHEVNGII